VTDRDACPLRAIGTWTYITPDGARVEEYLNEYELNRTGREVWLLCDGRRTVGQIAEEMARRFEAVPECCERDVAVFIQRLCSARLASLAER
jgi:hypothetical protein